MSKNIVVGIDGTWNSAVSRTGGKTNIPELLSWVNPCNQTKYYSPGVGDGLGLVGRLLYGATGRGVFSAAREAWYFIHENFCPGDKIFIFGFSRGAFAARHLASMIVRRGVRGFDGDIETEFREWLREVEKPCEVVQQHVHMLGLFDCVPGNHLYTLRDGSGYLNSGQLEPGIDHFRHAVAIHERRWSYRPIIFQGTQCQDFKQVWFPGCHSDVGGGHDIAGGLAAFSLWWMLREAHGLELDLNHVTCKAHVGGNALNVIQAVNTLEEPICSDWFTTWLGLRTNRQEMLDVSHVRPACSFADLDTCYRCGQQLFEALETPDARRRFSRMKIGTRGN